MQHQLYELAHRLERVASDSRRGITEKEKLLDQLFTITLSHFLKNINDQPHNTITFCNHSCLAMIKHPECPADTKTKALILCACTVVTLAESKEYLDQAEDHLLQTVPGFELPVHGTLAELERAIKLGFQIHQQLQRDGVDTLVESHPQQSATISADDDDIHKNCRAELETSNVKLQHARWNIEDLEERLKSSHNEINNLDKETNDYRIMIDHLCSVSKHDPPSSQSPTEIVHQINNLVFNLTFLELDIVSSAIRERQRELYGNATSELRKMQDEADADGHRLSTIREPSNESMDVRPEDIPLLSRDSPVRRYIQSTINETDEDDDFRSMSEGNPSRSASISAEHDPRLPSRADKFGSMAAIKKNGWFASRSRKEEVVSPMMESTAAVEEMEENNRPKTPGTIVRRRLSALMGKISGKM